MKVYSSLLSGARWPKNVAAFAVTALALSVAGPNANAQPPDRGATKTVQGTVRRSTTAPMGEIDGAVLDDGTVIHWPPHLAERASGVAVRGDQVRATGWMETGPEGDTHLEVRTIRNLRTKASFDNDAPVPPPPPGPGLGPRRGPAPPPPARPRVGSPVAAAATRSVQGTVQHLTKAPMGEVDGAILDDGTVIHWPPHLADRFSTLVARGDRVRASGWLETGPAGDSHFEVQSVTNLRTLGTAGVDGIGSTPKGADRSTDFAVPDDRTNNVERRLKALEDQIAKLHDEIQKIRDEL
jgi:glycine cleavage system aminomethyltransferase T